MTRTNELIGSGAQNLSGGESHPFIKWSNSYGFIEGEVRRIWTGVYGRVAEILLSDFGGELHRHQLLVDRQDRPAVAVGPFQVALRLATAH